MFFNFYNERVYRISSKKRNSSVADRGVRKSFPLSDRSAVSFKWLQDNPSLHVRAMVLTNKTLFIAVNVLGTRVEAELGIIDGRKHERGSKKPTYHEAMEVFSGEWHPIVDSTIRVKLGPYGVKAFLIN